MLSTLAQRLVLLALLPGPKIGFRWPALDHKRADGVTFKRRPASADHNAASLNHLLARLGLISRESRWVANSANLDEDENFRT